MPGMAKAGFMPQRRYRGRMMKGATAPPMEEPLS